MTVLWLCCVCTVTVCCVCGRHHADVLIGARLGRCYPLLCPNWGFRGGAAAAAAAGQPSEIKDMVVLERERYYPIKVDCGLHYL